MTCNIQGNSVASNRFKKTQGVKNKLKIILGGISCLLFIFISVLSIPVYTFRILVIFLAKIFRPDLGEILNGLSSVLANDYFYNSKSPRTNIVVCLVIHGRDLSLQELKEVLLARWIKAKDTQTGKLTFQQFQQYPVRWMGFTFWKNCTDIFNINDHVFLEEQKDMDDLNDEKLNDICEKLLNAPHPPNRSPWEIHLVKNCKTDHPSIPNNSKDQTTHVIFFKLHHCLADGYSILRALAEGLGQQSFTKLNLPVPTFPKRNFWKSITYNMTFPFKAFYELSYMISHVFHSSPWKVPDNKKEWYQLCANSYYIPIQKVKFIKTQLQVSFASVLQSAISSAICQSINNEKQNVGEPEEIVGDSQDNSSMYFLSVLPLPGHPNCLTNHCTLALFDLPIDKYESSVDRLHDVDNILESSKNTCLSEVIPLHNSVIGCHFYPVGKLLGTQRMAASGLTNFPSTPISMELFGRKWVSFEFVVGSLDGVEGVRIMVSSHGEYIRIAVSAEKAVMSKDEASRFVKSITNEIDLLYKTAMLSCSKQTLNVNEQQVNSKRDKYLAVG